MLLAVLTLALLAVLALGFQTFAAAPERPENRSFAAFSWIMALWILNDIAFWGFHGPDEDGRFWAEGAFLVAIAMQLAFLRFASIFPSPRRVDRRLAAALVAPAAVLTPVILAGRALGPVGFRGGRFGIELTPWTFAVGAYIYVLFFAGRLLLVRASRETADPQVRRQIGGVLLAPTITSVLTSAAIVVLPLAGVYALLPYSGFAIFLGTIIHAYAILNLRLFARESVLDRVRLVPVTAKLALAIAAASLAAVLAVLLVAWSTAGAALDAERWKRLVVFGLAASSVPTMAFIFVAQQIVARPIRGLTEAALEVAGGRTDVRVASGGARDEVAVLAAAFNAMVERLAADIEGQRELAAGLLRTERLATAGALAAGVAHEVNNPLAAVSSLVQTARGRTDDARSRELLDEAVAQMERVASALRDLMELARPRPAERRRCDANAIAERATGLLRYDRRFRAIEMRRALAADLPPLDADPDRIQQVILNLLLNARDAIEGLPAGSIEVATRRAEGGVEIAVADTGRGIAKAEQARVFEPFFTTKAPGAGTGLGLAVCRDIAREHGGRIALESEPGKGTRVALWLPAADEARLGAAGWRVIRQDDNGVRVVVREFAAEAEARAFCERSAREGAGHKVIYFVER
jgi:signal transduction histidine kinase